MVNGVFFFNHITNCNSFINFFKFSQKKKKKKRILKQLFMSFVEDDYNILGECIALLYTPAKITNIKDLVIINRLFVLIFFCFLTYTNKTCPRTG